MNTLESLASAPTAQRAAPTELRAGPLCDPHAFAAIRRRVILQGCKWDPQVGDVETLAPFPLILPRRVWQKLARLTEELTAEVLAAEQEILQRPDLFAALGLPRALRQVLSSQAPLTPSAGRIIRFDFHFTTDGWRISEANTDVPGGFSEASYFTAALARQYPGLRSAGDVAAAWADTLAAAAAPGKVVLLLSAPGYMEDHQVISFLAEQLRQRGCQTHLAKPEQIVWLDGRAHLQTAWHRGPADALVRFYQAEWLAKLAGRCDWSKLFRGGRTPVANPAPAMLSESKRFPLVWDQLETKLPAWRTLLPETRSPQQAPWESDNQWVLKAAYANTGDAVHLHESTTPRERFYLRWATRLRPQAWIAQRRFESVPIPTPAGPRHVCLGIYSVNGRAAGAYARLSPQPVINFSAVDAAVLIEHDD